MPKVLATGEWKSNGVIILGISVVLWYLRQIYDYF